MAFYRHAQKTLKGEELPKGNYIDHMIHDPNLIHNKLHHVGYNVIASIDPGVKNYAIRIERRPYSINEYHKTIDPLFYHRFSLADDPIYIEEPKQSSLYYILHRFLDSIRLLLLDCDMIIIEKQLAHGRQKSMTIEHHTIAYMMCHLRNTCYFPRLIEMDASTKYKELGRPTGMNEKALKKWGVGKAREILEKREDAYSINILDKNKKKLDDYSDVVCQIEAMFTILSLPLTDDLYP